MKRLEGKVAIVTGGGRGIGAAIARKLVSEGSAVMLCDVLVERAFKEAQFLTSAGCSAFSSQLDVTSEDAWAKAVVEVVERFGKLDILVNNAGINDRGTIMSSTLSNWERTLAVNLTGAYLGMRASVGAMRDSGGGAIINMCSLSSHQGEYAAAYGASKWGLRGLTKTAAMEFVEWNIRVNSVSPAVVETELNAGQPYLGPMAALTPMARNGKDFEIANGVAFLASEEASFITGQDLAIDGGFTAGAAAKYSRTLVSQLPR
jgi:3alpha(or 20beta)-hydroxysteroid dehydrogenase